MFKEVELLVHHAPVVERWKITAFLQPDTNLTKYENGTDKPLEYYGITLRISEMYFIPLEKPNKPTDLGIKVLLKNYIVHKDNPRLREAVYVHIEHLTAKNHLQMISHLLRLDNGKETIKTKSNYII